ALFSQCLLHLHRLMRTQLTLLLEAIVPALLFPSPMPGSREKFAISIWIILMTMKVHFTGITLARTSLTLQGADARRRQWGALALMLGAVGIVGAAIARVILARPLSGISDSIDRLGVVATAGV